MCTIDKMLIKGIRSFSPENTNVITFYKPLTLIVGPNGAGKTTIIECLKNACTGELPPNARSGQTFVHDPKVAGEVETKGQIKLRFKTGAGKDVVCIRSFQLTQKASKLEYKAIESVLQTINALTGEKVCLSYRCADMDREVPLLMGVSKAILENVIFVHQDEANWPLADPATLKKKFDDIFSATRYTKALESIKKLVKDQAQLIKQYKLKLDHLQDLRNAANRLLGSMKADEEKAQHLQQQIQGLEARINEAQARICTIEGSAKQLRELQQEVKVAEAKREEKIKASTKLLNNLGDEVSDDTDEELLEWASQFEQKMTSMRVDVNRYQREQMDCKAQIEALRDAFNKDCQARGKLQGEAEAHVADKGKRDGVIQIICARHNLGDPGPLPFSAEKAKRLSGRAGQRFQEMKKNFDQLKSFNAAELNKLTKIIDETKANYIQTAGQIQLKKREKDGNVKKTSDLERDIAGTTISEVDLRRIDEKEAACRDAVESMGQRLKEKNYDTEIERVNGEVNTLEQRIKVLQREKDGLANESAERVQLRIEKEELDSKLANLNKVEEEIKGRVKKLMKGTVPLPGVLKGEFLRVISSLRAQRDELSEKAVAAGKKLAAVEERLRDEKNRLTKHRREKDSKSSILRDSLTAVLAAQGDVDAYPNELDKAAKSKDFAKARAESTEGIVKMWRSFEEQAKGRHACPCCDRPFSVEEEESFVFKIKGQGSISDENKRALLSAATVAESKWGSLAKLQPIHAEYQRLRDEAIPKVEAAVNELSKELESARDLHDDCLALLAQASADYDEAERLRSPVETIDRLVHECKVARAKVDEHEYKLESISQGLRTMGDVQAELTRFDDQRELAQRRVKKLREEYDHARDELNKTEMRWRNAREEKLVALHKVEQLNALKNERRKLEADNGRLAIEIESFEQQLEPLDRDLKRLREEREQQKEKAEAEEGERSSQLQSLQVDLDKLNSKNADIEAYEMAGKDEQLKTVERRITSSGAKQSQLEEQMRSLDERLANADERIRAQADTKRIIDENIHYRQVLGEQRQLEQELTVLTQRIQDIGDPAGLDREIRRITGEVQAWLAEQNRSRGMVAAYESSVAKNRTELRATEYRDVEKRYREQLVQLKTTEMANKDLDMYYIALDRALMRFHSMKMEEINKIIKELWQQTYRGQDIDYIEIRSDAEGTGTRSYSYRVCMRSGDAELDMRGRCSAGQKVLASLIIRLALAETFCLNCGILALDEPTTNLDQPNAESLAGALLRIMEDRRGQENFQLVVITHDERFAQLIGQRQHAQHYYRISKDDHQHSKIEIQDIFD